jgi:hypothetical protein
VTSTTTSASHVDNVYGQVATNLVNQIYAAAGEPTTAKVVVVCWNPAEWKTIAKNFRKLGQEGFLKAYGFVQPHSELVNPSPGVCAGLDRISHLGERPLTSEAANAVGTLAHESMHVAGITDEALAECFGMQLTQTTSELLGTEPEYGYSLGKQLLDTYAQYEGTPYYTAECHDGSELDLFPETTVFP